MMLILSMDFIYNLGFNIFTSTFQVIHLKHLAIDELYMFRYLIDK